MFLVILIWFPSYVISTYSMDSMLEIETYIFKEYLLLFGVLLRPVAVIIRERELIFEQR